MRLHHLFALLIAIAPISARADENWADTAGDDKEFAASKAICTKAKSVKLPISDGPAAKGCDSSALLYGIGRPADPAAARRCAFGEMAAADANPTGGAATLATIYANGSGVARNYDIAIAFACRLDGAPAEMDARVKHLADLKTKGPGEKTFDICDDITSGAMEGFCAERQGDIADAKRKSELASLAGSLRGPSRAAFDKLERAEQAFVKAAADNEVDTSGTGRGAFIVENQQKHQDGYMQTLRSVLAGTLPAEDADAKDADKRLNAAYGKVMALTDTSGLGTVEKKGIRATQRLWIGYRDAFLTFAKTAAPAVPPDALAAQLTGARIKDLADLLGS